MCRCVSARQRDTPKAQRFPNPNAYKNIKTIPLDNPPRPFFSLCSFNLLLNSSGGNGSPFQLLLPVLSPEIQDLLMAMHRYEQSDDEGQTHLFLLDSLFCEEEKWEEEEEEVEVEETHLFPLGVFEEDLFWEDEQLLSLLSKETEQQKQSHLKLEALFTDPSLSAARSSAVGWMLKVNSHYGFSTLTAILAVGYLDRFLLSLHFRSDKPWMTQLVAVTCLSLAAKVEEIQVPLLLDLQVC